MYEIKWLQEIGWAVVIAVAVFVLTGLTGIEQVTEWKVWLTGMVAGIVRVAAAAALNEVRRLWPEAETA